MSKLLHLDDMFTLYHAVFLADSHFNSIQDLNVSDEEEAMRNCEQYATQCQRNADKYAPFNPWRSPVPWDHNQFDFDHIEPVEDNLINAFNCELIRYLDCSLLLEDSPTEWWTPIEDMLLIRGVVNIGWPSDKCRYESLRKYLIKSEPMGYLSRGPLEVTPEFMNDIVVGGTGYCTDTADVVTLTEKELLFASSKNDLVKRLKEIVHVLENVNGTLMSLGRRQKPTFCSNFVKILGRYGKPVDITPVEDAYSEYELTTTQAAKRTSAKIVRRSEMAKIMSAVEAVSAMHMMRQPASDCDHAVSGHL